MTAKELASTWRQSQFRTYDLCLKPSTNIYEFLYPLHARSIGRLWTFGLKRLEVVGQTTERLLQVGLQAPINAFTSAVGNTAITCHMLSCQPGKMAGSQKGVAGCGRIKIDVRYDLSPFLSSMSPCN